MLFEEESVADLLLNPCLRDEDAEDLFPGERFKWDGLSLAAALLPLVDAPESPPSAPPHPATLLCSTRYKTELCSRYAETGACKYGERCQFAHGLRDLRVPSRHPKYKTEPCRAFHAVGRCAYGARCLFVHEPGERRQVRPRRRPVPCRTFRAFGVCPFGARCNFLHIPAGEAEPTGDPRGTGKEPDLTPPPPLKEWKPRGALCRTFSAFGFCLYGTRCRFQHSVHANLPVGRALSPASDRFSSSSSSSSSPPSDLASPLFLDDSPTFPLTPPPVPANPTHNAFTFSSQHLSDLLLPLAWRLQQLESTSTSGGSLSDPEDKPL